MDRDEERFARVSRVDSVRSSSPTGGLTRSPSLCCLPIAFPVCDSRRRRRGLEFGPVCDSRRRRGLEFGLFFPSGLDKEEEDPWRLGVSVECWGGGREVVGEGG